MNFAGSVSGVIGVPDISAVWERSRYKVESKDKVEGIMMEYRMPKGKQNPAQAVVKIKYRYVNVVKRWCVNVHLA